MKHEHNKLLYNANILQYVHPDTTQTLTIIIIIFVSVLQKQNKLTVLFMYDVQLNKPLAIKLTNIFYLLFKHFYPFLNLFPYFYVPSIKKKSNDR